MFRPRRAWWVAVLVLVGCSSNPPPSGVNVEVTLAPGLTSRCMKVELHAEGAMLFETKPISLEGREAGSIVEVGIASGEVPSRFEVQALGYSDDRCIIRQNEASETRSVTFESMVQTVSLTLARTVTDGGIDAGIDGGSDGGSDAGIDADQDGYDSVVDCNDFVAAINPGAMENCDTPEDENCDDKALCDDPTCNLMACGTGGQCMNGGCDASTETGSCADGLDNDHDGKTDCADEECVAGACNDGNACTTTDQCRADAGCAGTQITCTTPPAACLEMVGVCGGDGGCQYQSAPNGTSCAVPLSCATGSCQAGACVAMSSCTTTNVCARPRCGATGGGTCVDDPIDAGSTCNDSNACTENDACDGDGGCRGTPVNCTVGVCQVATCNPASGCGTMSAPEGTACPGGTCRSGSCSRFPFVPSNFTDADLPSPDAGASGAPTCLTVTVDTNDGGTSGAPGGCQINLGTNFRLFTPAGGQETMIWGLSSLVIGATTTVTIVGQRPLIFAVTGDVAIAGTVRATNASDTADCGPSRDGSTRGGGGGGGFGTVGGAGGRTGGSNGPGAGAAGAAVGVDTLTPIRSGCRGGDGAGGAPGDGGRGGGALQISASGTLVISGTVSAPGAGGKRAIGAANGSGGGGAGSGGAVLLEATTLTVTGTGHVAANGGGGGEGSKGANGNDGADASDGLVGGAGGLNGSDDGGNGGAGAGRSTAAAAGAGGATDASIAGGGGGGGGVGRVRLNAFGTCTVPAGALSPQATQRSGSGCANL